MENKLRKAIRNNNDLYEVIFDNKNIKYGRTELIWYSREKTPRLYSNLVTVSKDWKPDDIFLEIDLNYEKENWDKWSIKDSFRNLDLYEYGFEKLFDAEWIYLDHAKFEPDNEIAGLRYEILSDENALSSWRSAWDADERLGKEIFLAELLRDPRAFFIAGYEGERIVSGCLANKTEDVIGISNFFAPSKSVAYWSKIVGFIIDSAKGLDIVGYERKETVDKLRSLGFESVGNLAVWLKKRIL